VPSARASAPRLKATAVVNFMLIIENIRYQKRVAGVNVLLDRINEGGRSLTPKKNVRDVKSPKN
jgi:uncharacterized protein YaaR (DUF327 family)